ncbi:MAG TPA: alpha/beta fold hydrolase [Piscinibacter sp.]|nr:alpha/beta fold hydrolase [Piscinibacter sp.]
MSSQALGPFMLARLQQAITLGLMGAAALWAVLLGRAGHAGWAVAGALLLVLGHALVLGLEFALLAVLRGDDPAPRARAAQLLAAWWGETRAALHVFCWRQPFRSRRWPDRLAAGARGRSGVLLLHGFFCNRGLWNRWLARLHAAGVPVVALNLEPAFGSIEAYAALIDAAVARLERCTGGPPIVVAHSMGGLALRHWYAGQADAGRLRHAITIGTPHRGTWLARWAHARNARQMRLHSGWLAELERREDPARQARFSCYYGHCDNIVFPPSTATLPGAANHHLPAVAHVAMVDHPAPWAELERRLAAGV